MSIEKIIERVERLHPSGNGYRGSCPTGLHRNGDRSRGLHVAEGEGGRVLLHCYAGCEVSEILAALGLTFSDLFPEKLRGGDATGSYCGTSLRMPARELLEVLDHEICVSVLILSDVLARRAVNERQVQRLARAAGRIGKARDLANPLKGSRHAA